MVYTGQPYSNQAAFSPHMRAGTAAWEASKHGCGRRNQISPPSNMRRLTHPVFIIRKLADEEIVPLTGNTE